METIRPFQRIQLLKGNYPAWRPPYNSEISVDQPLQTNKMNLYKKSNSKLSLSCTPDCSSVIYKTQTVQVFSSKFPSNSLSIGKLIVKHTDVCWSCPFEKQVGSFSLESIARNMQENTGFLIEQDAASVLENCFHGDIRADLLIGFVLPSECLFIEFRDPGLMDKWVEGMLYLDFLALMNDIALECLSSVVDSLNSEQEILSEVNRAWIFDLNYQQITEEEIKIKLTFTNESQKLMVLFHHFNLSSLNILQQTYQLLETCRILVDCLNSLLIESFIVNCLREKIVVGLSRDIITPYNKQPFSKKGLEEEHNSIFIQWYHNSVELEHKIELISMQLDRLRNERIKDDLSRCFRILELQKIAMQIDLHMLSTCIVSDLKSEQQSPINKRIEEINRIREEASQEHPNRSSAIPPHNPSRSRFTCECSVL